MAVFHSRVTKLFKQATDIDLVKVVQERVVRLVDEIISKRVIQEGIFTNDVMYRQFVSIAAYLDDHDFTHIKHLGLTYDDLAQLERAPRIQWLRDIASAELQLTMIMDLRELDQAIWRLESIVGRYIPSISEDLETHCLRLLMHISKREIWIDVPLETQEGLDEDAGLSPSNVIDFPIGRRRR